MHRIGASTLLVALSGALALAGCGERVSEPTAPVPAEPIEAISPSEQPASPAESPPPPAPEHKAARPPAKKAPAAPAPQTPSEEPAMDPNMDHSNMPGMEPKK